MSVQTYINFQGNCREALNFYKQVFGAKEHDIMTYGDAPPDSGYPIKEDYKNFIMHTALEIYGTLIMFSDILPDEKFVTGNNISMVIMLKDTEEIKSLYDQLKVGGSIEMELQETFFSKYYGSVKDKFGIIWQIMHDEM